MVWAFPPGPAQPTVAHRRRRPRRTFARWQGDLRDPSAQVRKEAIEALGRFGLEAIDVLASAMGDSDPKVRIAAVDSLVGFGPAAVSAMVDRLKDKDSGVRGNAAEALGRIGPDAEDAVKPLARAVGDSDARVREVAAWALGKIGPASRDAVPALTQALRDRSLAGCWKTPRLPFDKPVLSEVEGLRANGACVENIGDFPFMLSLSKHEKLFFSILLDVRKAARDALSKIGRLEAEPK